MTWAEWLNQSRKSRPTTTLGVWMVVCSVLVPLPLKGASQWGGSPWNDRRAEVAFYDAECMVNGAPQTFKEQLITVKEEFRDASSVKPGSGKRSPAVRVFRFSDSLRLETGNYPVSELLSVYVNEDAPSEVVKLTVGTQDWTGTTFKVYRQSHEGAGGVLNWHSDHNPGMKQSYNLSLNADDLFDDQLPITLRTISFKQGYQKKIRLLPSLLGVQAIDIVSSEAVVNVKGEEVVRCRSGSLPCWLVTVERGGKTDSYWFDKKNPHILVKMIKSNGQKRLLTGRARWSYWDKRIPKPNILY